MLTAILIFVMCYIGICLQVDRFRADCRMWGEYIEQHNIALGKPSVEHILNRRIKESDITITDEARVELIIETKYAVGYAAISHVHWWFGPLFVTLCVLATPYIYIRNKWL